ncbi:TetR/AcrR family transcriptional regulator [Sphaerisporangium sp. TRM90804]|uniref:TetR/AcrR family transcriptional regulator n=1 Tax=Sphaerisporangium sp. TRM90804 TaxID=3031113 RepID=UPI002447E18A|nr:TetR/AcrR family transcriptional regulator [Sphaerisporangium sp. TRM90804]MDH2426689.1 TetR/AcrR family transcriptional regulator [Sphaerisporangium sp. TRM90804]
MGTGTVSRHFPTKESLFEAMVLARVERLVTLARSLAATEDPGPAFFAFFTAMVAEGATDRGLADAFSGVGYDVNAVAGRGGHDVGAAIGELLTRAQEAGAVRPGTDTADVKALMAGCLAREREGADAEARHRVIAVVCDGLRTG